MTNKVLDLFQGITNVAGKLLLPRFQVPAKWKSQEYMNYYKGHVFAAVDLIGDAVSEIQFELKSGNVNNWTEVPAHPILDLIYEPSDLLDKESLIKIITIHYLMYGEVFLFTGTNERGIPTALFPLTPYRMTIFPASENEEGLISKYQYTTANGQITDIPVDQIAYLRNPHPEDPLRGISTLEAAALAVDTDTFAAEWNRNFFFNSAVPLGAFASKTTLTDSQFKRLKEEIKSRYGGKDKAHSPAVLDGGLEWQDIGIRQKDMDFLEQRKFSREEIFEIFKVPMALITPENVNRANAEVAERQFAKRVVKKMDNRLVTFINNAILPAYKNPKLFMDFEDPTPEDVESNRSTAQTGKDTGALTLNEIRDLLGYDAIDGDDADIPIGQIPGSNPDIKPKQVKKGRKVNVSTKHFSSRDYIEEEVFKAVKERLNAKPAVIVKDSEFVVFSEVEKDQIWKALDDRSQDYEAIFKSELNTGLEAQETRVRNKVEQGGQADSLLNLPAERVAFVALLVPLLTRILAVEGNRTLDFVGTPDKPFDMQASRITKYLTDYGLRFIDYMNQTTKDTIIKSLAEGLGAGESIPQLSNRITQIYSDAKGYRAERISRTEVGRAVSSARLDGFRQSGVVKGKEWLTARDKYVRDSHASQEGQVRDSDKQFANGCMAPRVCGSAGESINCRCDMLPVLKKAQKYAVPEYKSRFTQDISLDYMPQAIADFAEELNTQLYLCTQKKRDLSWTPKSKIIEVKR